MKKQWCIVLLINSTLLLAKSNGEFNWKFIPSFTNNKTGSQSKFSFPLNVKIDIPNNDKILTFELNDSLNKEKEMLLNDSILSLKYGEKISFKSALHILSKSDKQAITVPILDTELGMIYDNDIYRGRIVLGIDLYNFRPKYFEFNNKLNLKNISINIDAKQILIGDIPYLYINYLNFKNIPVQFELDGPKNLETYNFDVYGDSKTTLTNILFDIKYKNKQSINLKYEAKILSDVNQLKTLNTTKPINSEKELKTANSKKSNGEKAIYFSNNLKFIQSYVLNTKYIDFNINQKNELNLSYLGTNLVEKQIENIFVSNPHFSTIRYNMGLDLNLYKTYIKDFVEYTPSLFTNGSFDFSVDTNVKNSVKYYLANGKLELGSKIDTSIQIIDNIKLLLGSQLSISFKQEGVRDLSKRKIKDNFKYDKIKLSIYTGIKINW